jgi:cysteine synthase A
MVRVEAAADSRLAGISPDFSPPLLASARIDAVRVVSDAEVRGAQLLLARTEGILVGPATGAAVFVALALARERGAGRVLAVATESGERSLSSSFSEAS